MRRPSFLVSAATLCLLVAGCSANIDKNGGGTLNTGGDSGGGGFDPGDGGGFDPGGGLDGGVTGTLDPNADNDGDGYFYADDCDDRHGLVNPGAFDVPGDNVDNDCDGKIDNAPGGCDGALSMTSTSAMDFAKALGLCQAADPNATGKNKRWGVVGAKLTLADGKGTPMPKQYGIQKTWGTVIKPKEGGQMVVLSTGSARMPGQTGYQKPLDDISGFPSDSTPNESTPPAGWPKNSTGCPAPATKTANDSAVLQLQIRVPTNAKTFTYDFDFFTSEYIEYVCSPYNDSYVAILKSGAPLDASHSGNISFDSKGNPINVNSGFFEVCTPGTNNGKTFACKLGTAELNGTGYSGDGAQDGSSSWLRTSANVLPGETITLSFMIWNTGDHLLQSAVVLDNFQWSAEGATAPVTDRPPS